MSDIDYRVKSGETLSELARRYRVSVDVLARLNGLSDINRLRAGQWLKIPKPGYSSGSTKTTQFPAPAEKSARKLRVTGLKAPKTAPVGKTLRVEVSQFIPLHPPLTEKAAVSWAVEFEGKVIERFQHHGPILKYQVPYFLIQEATGPKPHRSPLIDFNDKALSKLKRTALVNKTLHFKAHGGNERESISKTVELEPNYDRFDKILDFMFGEMTRNARGKDAQKMRARMSKANIAYKEADRLQESAKKKLSWTQALESVEEYARAEKLKLEAVAHEAEAAKMFYDLVKENSVWDHKPKLQKDHGTKSDAYVPFRGDPKNEYFHDIWSNVHFAYVGRAIGFSDWVLMTFGTEVNVPTFGANDGGDRIEVQIGLDIWKKHGLNLKKEQLVQGILAARQQFLDHARQEPDNKKIQAIRNGY